jgi:hypothetical protein
VVGEENRRSSRSGATSDDKRQLLPEDFVNYDSVVFENWALDGGIGPRVRRRFRGLLAEQLPGARTGREAPRSDPGLARATLREGLEVSAKLYMSILTGPRRVIVLFCTI